MSERFVSKLFGRKKYSKDELEKIDHIKNEIHRSVSLNQKGEYKKGFKLADQAFKDCKESGVTLSMFDAIISKGIALLGLGKLNDCLNVIKEGEYLLSSTEQVKRKDISKLQAILKHLRGNLNRKRGNLDLALDKLQNSLSIFDALKKIESKAGILNDIGIIHAYRGDFDQAIGYFQQSLDLLNKIGIKTPTVNIFNNLGLTYTYKGKMDQAIDYYNRGLDISEKMNNQLLTVTLLFNLGHIYINKGNFISAAENIRKSQTQYEIFECKYETGTCFNNFGAIHELKGDLDQSTQYYSRSLSIFEELDNGLKKGVNFNNIGNTHVIKGDIKKAQSHYEKSLTLFQTIGNDLLTSQTLFNLISVNVQRDSSVESKKYLEILQKIDETADNKFINQTFRLAKALVLKSSDRVIKQAEAQQIFENIAEEETIDHSHKIIAKMNLCELLLQELSSSGSKEVLNEIKSILNSMLTVGEKQGLHSLLVEIYLINFKMALLELDLDLARQLIGQGRKIAEEKGLQRLELMVSREYDLFLTQISKWTEFVESKVSLTDRLEFAELESMVTRMIRKKVDIQELPEEEPVIFLILNRGGMSMFSRHFVSKKFLADQLIGGFLTAINAFTQQAFSESGTIEGIRHKDNTILMKPTESLLCCYVFKGPSYYALQKLKNFSEAVKVSDTIWDILTEASLIGMDVSEETVIQDLVTKIFLSTSEKIQQITSESFFSHEMNATITQGIYLDNFYFEPN
ncbi:MAG: tetratricopeptide repeat protein [Candidatus Hodarchaeales archaeon]